MRGYPIDVVIAKNLGTCTRIAPHLLPPLYLWLSQIILHKIAPLVRWVRDLQRLMDAHRRPPSRSEDQARKLFVLHLLASPDPVRSRLLLSSMRVIFPLIPLLQMHLHLFFIIVHPFRIASLHLHFFPPISCPSVPSPPTFTTTLPSILGVPRSVPSAGLSHDTGQSHAYNLRSNSKSTLRDCCGIGIITPLAY